MSCLSPGVQNLGFIITQKLLIFNKNCFLRKNISQKQYVNNNRYVYHSLKTDYRTNDKTSKPILYFLFYSKFNANNNNNNKLFPLFLGKEHAVPRQ